MARQFLRLGRAILATSLLAGTAGASAQSFSYLNVAGSSFVPRDSGTKSTYQSAGCISRASGDGWFVYPLQLPDGSRIKYVQVYFYDANATANLSAALTRYDSAGSFIDETVFTTSWSSGFGSEPSPEMDVVVDNMAYATQLLAQFGDSSSNLQFCGMRVAYYADVIFTDGFDG